MRTRILMISSRWTELWVSNLWELLTEVTGRRASYIIRMGLQANEKRRRTHLSR